jgi:hypothetical protein
VGPANQEGISRKTFVPLADLEVQKATIFVEADIGLNGESDTSERSRTHLQRSDDSPVDWRGGRAPSSSSTKRGDVAIPCSMHRPNRGSPVVSARRHRYPC